MITQQIPHLFIHIVTHETFIGQYSDLPDNVSIEYEDLGPIMFKYDRIYINGIVNKINYTNGIYTYQEGDQIYSIYDGSFDPWYSRLWKWIFG